MIIKATLFVVDRKLPNLALLGPEDHLLEAVSGRVGDHQLELQLFELVPGRAQRSGPPFPTFLAFWQGLGENPKRSCAEEVYSLPIPEAVK